MVCLQQGANNSSSTSSIHLFPAGKDCDFACTHIRTISYVLPCTSCLNYRSYVVVVIVVQRWHHPPETKHLVRTGTHTHIQGECGYPYSNERRPRDVGLDSLRPIAWTAHCKNAPCIGVLVGHNTCLGSAICTRG